jgi:pyruvate kinase
VDDMQIGGKIMLADGLIALEVVEKKNDTELLCTVLNDGTLGEKKNVNLPGVIVRLPALAQKDENDLRFGCEQQVDYIAASFVRKASDMDEIRAFLDAHGGKYIKIIAKIENQE